MGTLVMKSGYQHALILENRVSTGDQIKAIDYTGINQSPDLFSRSGKSGLLDNDDYYISAFSLPLNNGEKFYFVSSMNKDVIEKDVYQTLSIIFKTFLLSAIVVLLIGLYFARRGITEPVDRLIDTARQIKFGNYKPDISYAKENEFGVLAKTLVKMAGTINIREININ